LQADVSGLLLRAACRDLFINLVVFLAVFLTSK
jgi:hypothetical protein